MTTERCSCGAREKRLHGIRSHRWLELVIAIHLVRTPSISFKLEVRELPNVFGKVLVLFQAALNAPVLNVPTIGKESYE